MNIKAIPPADYLAECFEFKDARLWWKERPRDHFKADRSCNMWNAKFAGRVAGRPMKVPPYWQVMIDGRRYLNHRVIAAMHGIDTSGLIDHRNGDGSDNRPENLRACNSQQNAMNNTGWRRKDAPAGVSVRDGKWVAYIRDGGRHRHLGTFASEDEALAARLSAERRLYGEFAASVSRGAGVPA